jgi:uncharacterized membrane protein YozB (DUF420 family)
VERRAHVQPAWVWGIVFLLIAIVLVFVWLRVVTDVPNVVAGTTPDPGSFEARYARYPWLAYAHIVPGVVYLGLAPIQLWRGFRDRHLHWHRRIGRVALTAGLLSGILGIVFGAFLSFGGPLQASASVVFGAWFVACLVIAYRAIRRRDVRRHRRWMIRAFAVGLGVGTIRILFLLFEGFELLETRDAFGVAFWLAWTLHVAAAELWLRWRPAPTGFSTAGAAAP